MQAPPMKLLLVNTDLHDIITILIVKESNNHGNDIQRTPNSKDGKSRGRITCPDPSFQPHSGIEKGFHLAYHTYCVVSHMFLPGKDQTQDISTRLYPVL